MKHVLFFSLFATALWAQPGNLAVTSPNIQIPKITNRDEVVLTVGNRKITAGQFEDLVKTLLPTQSQPLALGPGRRTFAEKLAELLALAGEAEKLHLDQDPAVAIRLKYVADARLALAMKENLNQTLVVPETEIQAWYDAHKSDFEILKARYILIRVKGAPSIPPAGKPELSDQEALTKAQSIRKRLLAGEDFAALAKAESDDVEKGGTYSDVKRGVMVAQFENAAFALKPGEISQPVSSPFGYYIIQVQSRTIPPLADVKQDVITRARPTVGPKLVEEMINKTGYHLDEQFFGPDPATASPASGK